MYSVFTTLLPGMLLNRKIVNKAKLLFSFKLEHKLVSVPERKQQHETLMEQEKRKLNVIEELAPIKSNVSFYFGKYFIVKDAPFRFRTFHFIFHSYRIRLQLYTDFLTVL